MAEGMNMEPQETEELSSAQDEVVESTVDETPQEVPAEPDDNAARSKLGRRVKDLEDRLEQSQSAVERLLAHIEQKEQPPVEDDEYFITKENLPKYLQNLTKAEQAEMRKYEGVYVKVVDSLKESGKDLHDEIFAKMKSEKQFNVRYTGNPVVDARLNYLEAKSALLEGGKKTNLRQEEARGTGVSADGRSKAQEAKAPELDQYSKEFLADLGKDVDWAKKALKGKK